MINGMVKSEYFVKKFLERQGCQVYKNGWPDFLVITSKGKLNFIEVKGPRDRLRKNQKLLFNILKQYKIPVKILGSNGKKWNPKDCKRDYKKEWRNYGIKWAKNNRDKIRIADKRYRLRKKKR